MIIHLLENNFNLSLEFINKTAKPSRIWEFHNSWGWSTIKFLIQSKKSPDKIVIVHKSAIKAWTKNNPTFIEIGSFSSQKFEINFFNGEWDFPRELAEMKNDVLLITCILDVPVSEEAKVLSIFVGKIQSEKIISKPPHKWLFQEEK